MALTPKQEKFAKLIALEDKKYAEAYREAYNAGNMKNETIYNKASDLADRDDIRARIEELRAEADSPKVMSAQRRRERLTEYAECGDPNIAMKAIDLLNKMTGEYVQKVVAEVDNNVNINIELVDD